LSSITSAIVLTNLNSKPDSRSNAVPISLSDYDNYLIDREFTDAPSEAAIKSSLKTLVSGDKKSASISADNVDITINRQSQSIIVSPKPNNLMYVAGDNARIYYQLLNSTGQQIYVDGNTTLKPGMSSVLTPGGLVPGTQIT
jgi:hypothetical protein